MKIIIIGGFLGAGKTTVILQLARYLVSHANADRTPVVILENEISSAGVDNQMLSQANFTVENIFAGCICCSSSGLMCENIKKIEEKYNPEWLILEATGMAYPDGIKSSIHDTLSKDAEILALVDAKRWKRTLAAMPAFIESQLKDAKVILINKVDLIADGELGALKEEVHGYNNSAEIFSLCAIEPVEDSFWEVVIRALEE